MLPQAVFEDVLRVRIIAEATDTTVLGQGLYERNYIHDTTYIWLSPSYHAPLCMLVNSSTDRVTTLIGADTMTFPEELEYHSFIFDPIAEPASATGGLGKSESEFQIFPNPFKGFLQLEFTSNETQSVTFALRDLYGHEVFSKQFTALQGPNLIPVHLPDIPPGPYLAFLQSAGEIRIRKILGQ
jgi:hypothetical protein